MEGLLRVQKRLLPKVGKRPFILIERRANESHVQLPTFVSQLLER